MKLLKKTKPNILAKTCKPIAILQKEHKVWPYVDFPAKVRVCPNVPGSSDILVTVWIGDTPAYSMGLTKGDVEAEPRKCCILYSAFNGSLRKVIELGKRHPNAKMGDYNKEIYSERRD
jgi:hypothetical protein